MQFKRSHMAVAAVVVAAGCWPPKAGGTEFGNSHVDLGYIDTEAGLPLQPGTYLRDDLNFQTSSRFNDRNGNKVRVNVGGGQSLPLKFRSNVEASILSFAYVPDFKIPYLNATVGFSMYSFVANVRAEAAVNVFGRTLNPAVEKAGVGDLTVVPLFFGFDFPTLDLHAVVAPFDFTAPIGRYSKSDPIGNNTGLNFWSYRPALALTYLNKTGQEFTLNMGYSINSQNNATKYKSGDEFYFTYVAQQFISPKLGLNVGGYYSIQTTNDKVNGRVVFSPDNPSGPPDTLNAGVGNRGEVFAIGPGISYNPYPNLFLNAHWDHELFSYNKQQRELVYVRAAFRF